MCLKELMLMKRKCFFLYLLLNLEGSFRFQLKLCDAYKQIAKRKQNYFTCSSLMNVL